MNQTSASDRTHRTLLRRAVVAALAASMGVMAALWSGCGANTQDATNKINSAVDKASEQVHQAVTNGEQQAQQALDQVTGSGSTTSSTTSTSTGSSGSGY